MMLPGTGWRDTGSTSWRGKVGEVAAALCLGGNEANQTRRSVTQTRALKRPEEKQLLLYDRTADRAAELVALQRILNRREKLTRVHGSVADEVEPGAVKFVRAARVTIFTTPPAAFPYSAEKLED